MIDSMERAYKKIPCADCGRLLTASELGYAGMCSNCIDKRFIHSKNICTPQHLCDILYLQNETEVYMATVQELIQQYVDIRNELTVKRREFEAEEKEAKAKMLDIELELLQRADDSGVESFKTASGTAYKTTKTQTQISDWEAFSQYILDNKAMHLVQKRVAKLATLEELEAMGDDSSIPGIDIVVTREIQVRK